MALPVGLSLLGTGLDVAGNVIGAQIQASAAERAAEEQRQAISQGIASGNKYYGQGVAELQPYNAAGATAASQLPGMISGMQQPGFNYQQQDFNFQGHQDPGAEYALQEAAKALNASSIAHGAMGGGAQKAMATEQNNLAQTNYKSAWDRWLDESNLKNTQANQGYQRNFDWQNNRINQTAGLANMGEKSASTQSMLLGDQARNQFAPYESMGSSSAAGTLGYGNAMGKGLNGTLSALGTGLGSAWNNYQLDNADKSRSAPPNPWAGGGPTGSEINLAGVVGTDNTAGDADYGRQKYYDANQRMLG